MDSNSPPGGQAVAPSASPVAVYFPNLTGIRFVAALVVFIYHVSDVTNVLGLPHFMLPLINGWGKKGVGIFFVLSGFLITWLLMAERHKTASIDVRKFYIRRILRTWPLYYLTIFIGYSVFPYFSGLYKPAFNADLVLFLIFLPNIAGSSTWFVKHTWSIGVEEQFYLIWPLLMKRFSGSLAWLFGAVVLAKLGALVLIGGLIRFNPSPFLLQVHEFLYLLQFELMAIGGVGAYLLFHQHAALKFLLNPGVEKINLLLLMVVFITPYGSIPFPPFLLGGLFLVFIMNAAANKDTVVKLEGTAFRYLGSISYGIYMYHQMVIAATTLILQALSVPINWVRIGVFELMVYPVAFMLTVLIASASYHWIELPFIRARKKYSVIDSGAGARPE